MQKIYRSWSQPRREILSLKHMCPIPTSLNFIIYVDKKQTFSGAEGMRFNELSFYVAVNIILSLVKRQDDVLIRQ